jgi:hypothetical protein
VWLHQEKDGSLTRCRFLDLALCCEFNGDFKIGTLTAAKALKVKKDCQGFDSRDYLKFKGVLQRISKKRAGA